MPADLDGTIRNLSLKYSIPEEELRALVAAFEATQRLSPVDPDKTVPLPGRAAPASGEGAAPGVPDLITLAAAKGLLDEAAARRTLGGREATFANVVVAGLLAESAARELMLGNPDTLCRDCGWPLTPLGSDRVCTPCGVRRKHEDPRETEIRRLPPEVAAAARDEANVFGKYVRLEEIGHGGMGAVYRAWDRELSRLVALKLPKFDSAEDLQRFKREAELMACLGHPNIAAIYEIGEARGQMYLVMQLLSGASAAKRDLDVREAVRIVRDAARAVAAAHEKGVIHRDLKPENVMVDTAGRVFVLDFGLARRQEAEKSVSQSILAGTPAYMAPEHARGQALDQRADVYSLGATLYALAVGVPPYIGAAGDVIKRVQEEEPTAPRRVNLRIPRDVEIMIVKAMSKEKARRYGTATELAMDLDRWLNGEAITARPATWTYRTSRKIKRNPWAWAASATAAVIALGVAGFFGGRATLRAIDRANRADAIEEAIRRSQWREALELASEALRKYPEEARLETLRQDALAGGAGHYAEAARRALREGQGEAASRDASAGLAIAPADSELKRVASLAELMGRWEKATGEAQAARERASQAHEPQMDTWEPASRRVEIWRARRERQREELAARIEEENALQAAAVAFELDPELPAARTTAAELCLARHDDAAARRDAAGQIVWRGRTEKYGGDAYRERLDARATLSLTTRPQGAEAYLFRYEERDGRRFPFPANADGTPDTTVEVPPVDALPMAATPEEARAVRDGTAYPLSPTDANRVTFPLRLPPGSYLVLFRKEGYADARYPVDLARGGTLEDEVELVRADEVPPGFVWIPAGESVFGNDAEAQDLATGIPREQGRRRLGGYFLARYSVTVREYLEFLNDLPEQEAEGKIMRSYAGEGYCQRREGQWALTITGGRDDWPAFGISYGDCEAYAQWYTRKYGRNLWEFYIPSEEEWERAARGADGRFLPWGDWFDASLCAMDDSRRGGSRERTLPEAHGLFPADESPFGVRDMAGVIRNWTSTGTEQQKIVKGGSWGAPAAWCRSAYRNGDVPSLTFDIDGVRMAARRAPGEEY